MQIKDKTVLITGAARGIGQAIAKELAHAGAHIIGVDLCLEDMQDTAAAIQKFGRNFKGFACDVTDEPAVRNMIEEAKKLNSGFDVLINNAGVLPSGPFVERDFDVWRKTIEVNLIGLMALTQVVLPYFLSKNSGYIVNIASIAGKFGTEGVVAYAASKHGVVGFSSALREELRNTKISVSWICPSVAATRMGKGIPSHFLAPLIQPEDVARAVRRAIKKNASEVFVPRRVRFVVSIMPSLSQRLARLFLKWSKVSQGWLAAHKELEPE